MSKFKVGDAVRVKAGSLMYPSVNFNWRSSPFRQAFGKKCEVESFDTDCLGTAARIKYEGGFEGLDVRYLEPWNDSEEWDGEKWVAKKPADRWFRVNIEYYTFVKRGQIAKLIKFYDNMPSLTHPDWPESTNGWCFPEGMAKEVHNYNPEKDKPKPAIVILRENGVLKPNSPPIVHESTSKAKEEAKRLAEKHKGKEFVVFQEVDMKKAERPVYPELQRGDVMKAKHKVDLRYGWAVNDGEIVIVEDNGDELFGVWRGSQYLALRKSDFIKIGHVDL